MYAVVWNELRDGGVRRACPRWPSLPEFEDATLRDVRDWVARIPDPDLRKCFDPDAESTEVFLKHEDGRRRVLKAGVDRVTPKTPYEPGNDVWFDLDLDAVSKSSGTSLVHVVLPHGTTHVRVTSSDADKNREEFLGFRVGPGHDRRSFLATGVSGEMFQVECVRSMEQLKEKFPQQN